MAATFSLLLPAAACTYGSWRTSCGPGSVDKNGTCVGGQLAAQCGAGTMFVGGSCLPIPNCGPNTTPYAADAGYVFCLGNGPGMGGKCEGGTLESGMCNPCPVPVCTTADYDTKTTCVTGRVHDVNGFAPVDGVAEQLQALAYPPLTWIANPTTTPPTGKATIDKCGYFKMDHVAIDFSGDLAIAVLPNMGAPPNWIETGIALNAKNNMVTPPQIAYAVKASDDAAWSAAAMLPSGTTFASLGTMLVWYFDKTTTPNGPVGGVTPVDGCNSVPANQDYFFTSATPALTSLVAGTSNGNVTNAASGWAAITGDGTVAVLTGRNGTCSKGPCSSWDAALAAGPAGIYFVTTRGGM